MNLQEVEALLNKEIPISLAHQAHVTQLTDDLCEISVPLQPNRNHKGTVFGGSLYVACTFASYGLLISGMKKYSINSNNLVISRGEINYFLPVTGDFTVEAKWPSSDERESFFRTLKNTGKAKICIKTQILLKKKLVGEFSGFFVAKL